MDITKMKQGRIESHALLSPESTSEGLTIELNKEIEVAVGFQSNDRIHSTKGIRSSPPEVVASAESGRTYERGLPEGAVTEASVMFSTGNSGAYDPNCIREVEKKIGEVKMELKGIEKRIRRMERKLSPESAKYDARNLDENKALHSDLIRERRQLIEEKSSWRKMKNILIDKGVSELSRQRYPESPRCLEKQPRPEAFMETLKDLSYSCKWEGKYFEFPQEISEAAFGVSDTIVLHRRPAIDKLYNILNDRRAGLIQGPPGVGKSTSLFAYAIGLADSGRNRIVWIKSNSKGVLIIEQHIIKRFWLRGGSWDPVVNMVAGGNFQYIFVDQCRRNGDVETILTDLTNLANDCEFRLFAITSCNDIRTCGLTAVEEEISYDPWTLEEYKNALANPTAQAKLAKSLGDLLLATDKAAELKFYYAGISARFFFDFTISRIEKEVTKAIRRISDKQAYIDGRIGSASDPSVNTVFYSNPSGHNEFSSFYIAHRLVDEHDVNPQRFTVMTQNLGSVPNRGAVGYLFELFTHCMIRSLRWRPLAHLATLDFPYAIPERDTRLVNERMHGFDMDSLESSETNRWFVPLKANNPGFDSVYRFGSYGATGQLEKLVIVFLQVTCGRSHEFNCSTFATAASVICHRTRGFVFHNDSTTTRNIKKVKMTTGEDAESAEGTRIFIEVIFAIPEGQSEWFKVKLTGGLEYLENLDERWSVSRQITLEVPESQSFVKRDLPTHQR